MSGFQATRVSPHVKTQRILQLGPVAAGVSTLAVDTFVVNLGSFQGANLQDLVPAAFGLAGADVAINFDIETLLLNNPAKHILFDPQSSNDYTLEPVASYVEVGRSSLTSVSVIVHIVMILPALARHQISLLL